MRVLWFGTYSVGPGYPRNTVLMDSLREVGVEVAECHAPLFRGPADKVAASASGTGLFRFGLRAVRAWARLAAGYFRAGPRDVVVVGYTGHLDVYLARALAVAWRRPVVLDAFLSPYDTIVGDRALLPPASRSARLLRAWERTALRISDLVLTDTDAHADFMADTFGVARSRFLAVPVGSLVAAPAPVPVHAPVSGGGGTVLAEREFTAFFCGSFVPLQGVPYILDAAALAPDLRFEIVGDGVDGPRIEEEVKSRGMPNVGLDRRFVPREELEAGLARADAVLGIFGRTPKAGRVVPCKVYDGLAGGRPVVTGDSPAARGLLRDGEHALLVDRADPRALVRALRRLRDEPGLRDRLCAAARQVARDRFSRHVIGWRLRRAFQELVP